MTISVQLVPHGGITHEVGKEDCSSPAVPTEASGGARVQVPQNVFGKEVCEDAPKGDPLVLVRLHQPPVHPLPPPLLIPNGQHASITGRRHTCASLHPLPGAKERKRKKTRKPNEGSNQEE